MNYRTCKLKSGLAKPAFRNLTFAILLEASEHIIKPKMLFITNKYGMFPKWLVALWLLVSVCTLYFLSSVADPDPWDPYVLGSPGYASESISQKYESGSSSKILKIVRKH
jgi:hypothetical protein